MIVEVVLVAALAAGIVVFYRPEIGAMMDRRRMSSALRREKNQPATDVAETGAVRKGFPGINESLRRVMSITIGAKRKRAVPIFWAATAAPPLAVFFILAGRTEASLVMICAAFSSAIPALLLSLKLQRLRVSSSREGETLLAELVDNYKMNYFNMQQAIEITALTMKEAPNCRRLLFDLSKGVNRAGDGARIRELLDDFKFAVDTSWAGVLADNMYFALTSGVRVTEAMEDLLKTVSKAREVEELSGRENNEAGLILKYLAPACYVMTVVGGIKYFGLTWEEFVEYQFCTEVGLSWFTAAALIYVAAVFAKRFLTVRKLDL